MVYEYLGELMTLLSEKLITERKHPTLPLLIYNYSPAAQSLKIDEWSPALCDCRGLILDHAGNVVGRPFRKFWNYEQVLDKIPNEPFTVWEKLDGSLGIVCNYKGNLVVATRGSFESDQAKWAQGWLKEREIQNPVLQNSLPPLGLTYLFEIIYPENRIVVDYQGLKTLKLLAVVETDTGKESLSTFHTAKFDKAQSFLPLAYEHLVNADIPNAEGFVIRWASGFRAKVKFEEYKRLHRLITQVSTRSIWELLRAGKSLDELTDRVPQEFKEWVSATVSELKSNFQTHQDLAYMAFVSRPETNSRAEYAAWVKGQVANYGLLFALYDNKPVDDKIWKMIEPKWAIPFRREVEG